MADNKLLGVLELNPGKVMDTIDQVNAKLQSLGKGVDLDLTNILNAKVNSQLKELQNQIGNVNKEIKKTSTDSGGVSSLNNELSKVTQTTTTLTAKAGGLVSTVEKGFNAAGDATRQYKNDLGDITKIVTTSNVDKTFEKMGKAAVSALGAASLVVLKKQWTEAVDYATKYYDALNEIRVVTMMSEQDANRMGQNMRDLAEEMKVTSTELSEAAITFYRQGLSDSEVQDRLKWVTEYAKVAHMEFGEASELMTAAINTMGDSIEASGIENVVEHIADVWLYLGDHAATSGEEIGKAMQKASASATEFGLSFEWLGTYIAVVAEQTRQAPEAIGTAFNSMLARMHQIRTAGFNNEDTTKMNDVAKALSVINVELLDSEGQWRDMNLIYEDVAEKWSTLDARTKGYIATTMAGTKQQNVFYALMNDMSKGIEGGSRAWELYTGAMNAAGTATQKYAVYQESVEASQANLTNSLEQLYSNVMKPDVIKGFYNVITVLVDGLNNLGGVFPVVISGITGFTAAIVAAKAGLIAANPLIVALTAALGMLVSLGAMGGIGQLFGDRGADNFAKDIEKLDESQRKLSSLYTAQDNISTMFAKVKGGASLSAQEINSYKSSLDALASTSPQAEQAVRNLTQGFGDQTSALATLTEEAKKAIEAELQLQAILSEDALRNYQNSEEYSKYSNITTRQQYQQTRELMGDGYGILRYLAETEGNLQEYIAKKIADNILDMEDTASIEIAVENYFAAYETAMVNAAQKEATKIADNVATSLGTRMTSAQKNGISYAIMNSLMGDDGTLDYEDVSKERIQKIYADLIKIAQESLTDNRTILASAVAKFFGETLASSFEFENEIAKYAESSELTGIISDTIYALIEAGITKQDFANGEGGLPYLSDFLENGVLGMLQQVLDNRLGIKGINEYMGPGNWNLDEEATTIMLSLTKIGKSLEDFQKIANKSETLADFKKNLQELFKSDDGSGGGNEPVDFVKNIKAAYTEIDKIQSALDAMKDGKPVKLKDLLEIAESHPEIIAFSDDLATLKKKLEELKGLAKDDILKNLKEAVYGIGAQEGDFKNSYDTAISLGATGVQTVGDLRQFYESTGRTGGVAALDQAIDLYVNKLYQASEETTKLTSDFDDFLTSVSNLKQAKEALQIFQDLANGKAVDDTKVANAAKAISEIFDNVKLDPKSPTFILALSDLVSKLEAQTTNAGAAFGTLGQAIVDSVTKGEEALDRLKYATEDIVNSVIESGNHDAIGSYMEKNFGGGNVDLLNRKVITNEDGSWSTLDTQGFSNEAETMYVVVTPITPDGERLTDDALQNYVDELLESGNPLEADKIENGGKGLLLFSEDNISDLDAVIEKYNLLEGLLHALQEAYYSGSNLRGFAKQAAEDVKDATAAASKYKNELSKLSSAFKTGGMKALSEEWARLDDQQEKVAKAFPNLLAAINKFEKATENAAEGTDEYNQAVEELNAEFEKTEKLNSEKYFENTAKAILESSHSQEELTEIVASYNTEQAKAIEVQEEYEKAVEKVGAGAELTASDVQKMASAFGISTAEVIKRFGDMDGKITDMKTSAEALLQAIQQEAILSIVGTSSYDFSDIMSGLAVVGEAASQTAEALMATGKFHLETRHLKQDEEYLALAEDGKSLVTMHATAEGDVQVVVPDGMNWGAKDTKTGSGGGGGGGNKTKTTRGSARVLQTMSNIQDLQQNTQSLYQAQAGYYEQTGQLQGVILYRQKEIEALEKMNATLETNLTELEQWIDAKKEELGTLDESSEEYKEVYGELEALMERHQEYTLAVIENKTQVVSLTDSIRDLKNEIRDMQIDVYNEVVNALKARDEAQQKLEERQKKELDATVKVQKAILDVMDEQKQKSDKMRQGALNIEKLILNTIKQQDAAIKRMLQGRIAMEQTVLSIIQAQAAAAASIQQGRLSMENTLGGVIRANIEKQRDVAVKAAQEADQAASAANERQIDALREQRDLLDEQLRLRKEAAKEQDRQAELAELEAQYARISADPTRMKEALKIREQIDKLRDEIAWDIAEKEVEAQQKAIDEQIDALSGQEFNSASAVSEYYDKLLDDTEAINAQIEEMLDTMSDAEIIEWLKENSEEYQDSTRIGKKAMVEDWQDQLNQMRGVTESFVDEIDAVLSGSREEILEWLKENDLEYAKASDAQKQQMVQDWEDALNEMYGITETHWDQVKEVMESGLEGFLDFMERNNTEYAEMSDTEKEITKQGWIDTWNEMTGEVEDHREDVASIMQEGYDAFLEYMMQNSEAFKTATAEEKLSMINSWKEMWDGMNTTTKNYEDEANAIIAKGQQAIIDTLTEYTENYAEVGRQQSEKYVDEWTSKLAELKAALESVGSMVDTVGSKYEALVATGAVDKANEIDSAKADMTIDALLDQAGLEHFAAGGLATTTGPVWVDGSPQLPERILSPYQTELFGILVRSMEEMSRVSVPQLPTFGNDLLGGNTNSSVSFGDIIVQVEHLDSDTDYDDMAEHVLDSVMERINRSAVVGGIRFSK